MRIWDISPELLCRKRLLGEHRELHGLWVILTENKKGFSRHPKTLRWRGELQALYRRHEALVAEMDRRCYRHATSQPTKEAWGTAEQVRILREKR